MKPYGDGNYPLEIQFYGKTVIISENNFRAYLRLFGKTEQEIDEEVKKRKLAEKSNE